MHNHHKNNKSDDASHYPDTRQEKFDNGTGIMTTAKPISSQTGQITPSGIPPDPAPKIPWSKSRFEWDSSNPGKGGEK
jgi:hypothetical protein